MEAARSRTIAPAGSCASCRARWPRRALALVGCAAVVVGAVGRAGTLVAMDRRSGGVRAGDQAIESKVTKAAAERWTAGTGVHLNVTSYDGKVLLTGEVPTTRHSRRNREDREVHRSTSAA